MIKPRGSVPELELPSLLGELARPFMHECNNFLNNFFLQAALLGDSVPELTELLERGKRLSSLTAQWQRFEKPTAPGDGLVRLDAVVSRVVDELRRERPDGASSITLSLGHTSPRVAGEEGDVVRSCHLPAPPCAGRGSGGN